MKIESRHQCFIYEGPPSKQLPVLAAMIQRKLDEGHRCMYMNSRPMVAGMRSYLASIGMDVVGEVAKARLVLSSEPAGTEDGGFDIELMLHKLEDALDQALNDGYKGLWVTGDMTWEFGSEKNLPKLMEYEWQLEQLFHRRRELHGICQYHQDTLPREVTRQGLLTHRTVFINQTLSRINPHFISSVGLGERLANPELDAAIAAIFRLQNTES